MVRFSSITLACPNPGRLAAFYAEITGGEVTFVHEGPRWPQDTSLVHIDFYVDDLAEAARGVEQAGALRFEHQHNAAPCLVFADPDGHPFGLSLIDEVH